MSQTTKSNVIQEVFLSPRVIDREAFNDYSGSLRKLIEEAAAQTDRLKAAAAEAQGAQQALRETAARNQGRLEAATKALAVIEQKTAEADRLMQSAKEADRNAQNRLAELNGKIEQMQRQAEENVRRLEKRATDSVQGFMTNAERVLAQSEAGLKELKTQAASPAGPDATVDARAAEASVMELRRLIGEAERQREAATSALVAVSQAAESAEARTRQLRSLHEQSEMAKTGLMDAIGNAAARIDDLLVKAEDIRRTAGTIGPACETAEQRVEETLGRIEASTTAARSIIGQTTTVVARLGELMEQLQPWTPLLLRGEGKQLPAPLQSAIDQAREQIGREAAGVAGALQEAAARMTALVAGVAGRQ